MEVARSSTSYTLRSELDRYVRRVFSDTWSVAELVYQASLAELRAWVAREYGDLDQERVETIRFVFDAAYFDT